MEDLLRCAMTFPHGGETLSRSPLARLVQTFVLAGIILWLAGCAAFQQAGEDQTAVADPNASSSSYQNALAEYQKKLVSQSTVAPPADSNNGTFIPPTVHWEGEQSEGKHKPTNPALSAHDQASPPSPADASPHTEPEPDHAVAGRAQQASAFGVAGQAGATSLSGDNRETLLDALRRRVRVEESPLKAAVINAALALADPAPTQALDPADLRAIDRDQAVNIQRFHQLLISLMKELADGDGELDRRKVIRQMDEALGPEPLAITDLQLCTRVDNFGLYTPLPRNVFIAGRTTPVIVYSEIDHFHPQPIAGGKYEVRLSQEITLYEDGGLDVWHEAPAAIIDQSRNQRRDFYIVQQITLPANLTVGRYQLKITLRDEYGGTRAERTLPLEIIAGGDVSPRERLIQSSGGGLDARSLKQLLNDRR